VVREGARKPRAMKSEETGALTKTSNANSLLFKPGDVIDRKSKSSWDVCTVIEVHGNVVLVHELPRFGKHAKLGNICLKPGVLFEVKRHPMKGKQADRTITTFKVSGVGVLMTMGQVFRVAVVQRKIGPTGVFLGLEMWNASHLSLLPSEIKVPHLFMLCFLSVVQICLAFLFMLAFFHFCSYMSCLPLHVYLCVIAG
jgi:hypothetical protein